MPKNLLQDIKPIRRTTRRIDPASSLSSQSKKQSPKEQKPSEEKELIEKNDQSKEEEKEIKITESREDARKEYEAINRKILSQKYDKNNGSSGSRYTLWLVAIVALVFLIFSISSLFSKARITINPKIQDFTLNQSFEATKDANSSGALSFNIISLSGEEEKLVPTGEEKEYTQKAKGTVVLYNNFSSASQKLAIDTRLEGSNGKMYKTSSVVTIPGIKDGKPGSVEVEIYANEPGDTYNSSPIDFKILGFKGTPKYEKIYGRSKGDITGGLVGKLRLVGDEDKAKAVQELKVALQEKLFKKASGELPEGYLLFKDAVVFRVDDENMTTSAVANQNEVPVKIKGTLYGFLFEETNLTKGIVETIIPKYDGSEVYIPNLKDFNIVLASTGTIFNFSEVKNINFSLSGSSKIVWYSDEDKLKSALAGKSKKDFKSILSQYPNIDSADLVVRPVWKRDIPEDLKDIKIIINSPK